MPWLADWCVVDLAGEDGALHRLAVVHADPAKQAAADRLRREYPAIAPGAAHTATQVARSGRPRVDPHVSPERLAGEARDAAHLALLQELGFGAELVAPLVARGHVLGTITLVSAAPERYAAPTDLQLAEALALRCALAVDNARLYRQAQDAVRARDEFLSIAAHELRTPLTSITGQAQLLQRFRRRGTLDAARLDQGLDQIATSGARLAALTDDLLDVSRLEAGRFALRPVPLDLAAFVREVVARHAEQTEAVHSLGFAAEGACPVQADPVRLEQVVANLLSNAVKYSPEGGPVEVTVRRAAGGALVAVRDRGIGLPPGAAEAIFEPFGRAANATARHLPGLGLGLYL